MNPVVAIIAAIALLTGIGPGGAAADGMVGSQKITDGAVWSLPVPRGRSTAVAVDERPTRRPQHAFKIGTARGPRFDGFGVDIKKSYLTKARPTRQEMLTALVNHPAIDYVRVPFTAMTYTDDNKLDTSKYRGLIEQMRMFKERQPSLRFYLNRKNYTKCGPNGTRRSAGKCDDFPSWMKENGQLVPARYGRYMAEVLMHFRSEGIPIAFFGPDNEPFNNEGNLTAARFNRAVAAMRKKCECRLPVMVGNDSITNRYGFMKPANIRVASMHSNVRKFKWQQNHIIQITKDAKRARLPLWNTEFHWDHWSKSFMIRSFNSLPQMLWQACRGVRMVSFWALHDATFKNTVMSTWVNSRCRRSYSKMRGVSVFANDRGYVWVLNPTRNTYRNKRVDHNGFRYTRWRDASPHRGRGWKTLRFPARSITLIKRR